MGACRSLARSAPADSGQLCFLWSCNLGGRSVLQSVFSSKYSYPLNEANYGIKF